jgi:hypothetical protein
MSSLAGMGVELLLFWDVPVRLRTGLVTALVCSPFIDHRRKR